MAIYFLIMRLVFGKKFLEVQMRKFLIELTLKCRDDVITERQIHEAYQDLIDREEDDEWSLEVENVWEQK